MSKLTPESLSLLYPTFGELPPEERSKRINVLTPALKQESRKKWAVPAVKIKYVRSSALSFWTRLAN